VESNSRDDERSHQPLLTARDLSLLGFAAQHRLILAGHAQSLLGVSARVAQRRMTALTRAGYLEARRVFAGQPACYRITRDGLGAAGSDLAPPRLDVRGYAHDVGVAWLWLAARRGAFGPLKALLAERTLRSEDARAAAAARAGAALQEPGPVTGPYGVRLGGLGAQGRERLHYPDLLLVTEDGRRIAVELELTSKGRSRREGILSGHGADARVSTVLYLVDRPAVGRAVEASARRLGMAALVQVQRVHQTLEPVGGDGGTTLDRTACNRRDEARGAER
jgi:hypothetical protein